MPIMHLSHAVQGNGFDTLAPVYVQLITTDFTPYSAGLMVGGAFLFIIGFCGCCGAWKEWRILLGVVSTGSCGGGEYSVQWGGDVGSCGVVSRSCRGEQVLWGEYWVLWV